MAIAAASCAGSSNLPKPGSPAYYWSAANAAYRASRFDVTDREASVRRMEIVIRRYADVLRNSPDCLDAAYNDGKTGWIRRIEPVAIEWYRHRT